MSVSPLGVRLGTFLLLPVPILIPAVGLAVLTETLCGFMHYRPMLSVMLLLLLL